ncbi:MAG: ribonuclease P protein component [Tannerella sp.]|jgi:ribonuclease P protein component|nr:ribonuclease P protein component [Tannerella sp.]
METEANSTKAFRKSERLCLNKDIDRLFEAGQSFIAYPLRVIYLSDDDAESSSSGASILVSVPKKRIRHAVGRNRIKRLIRETYRLNKGNFIMNQKSLHIAFTYVTNEILPYSNIEKAMLKALNQLQTLC